MGISWPVLPRPRAFTLRERLRWFWLAWRLRDDFLHRLSEVVFRSLELFGMGCAPLNPDGNQQRLEYPSDRRSKERFRDPIALSYRDSLGALDHKLESKSVNVETWSHQNNLDNENLHDV